VSEPTVAAGAKPARVQLLVTCLVDTVAPHVGFAVVAVLERLGLVVQVPRGQTCCGQPAFNSGSWDDAREMARHTIDVFERDDAPIVVPSGSCGDMVIHQAVRLLGDDAGYAHRARAVAARTYELTAFLVDILGVRDVGAHSLDRVAYHPACHGLRGLGLRRQPEALLDGVRGAGRCPLQDAETCCGFGGLFAVKMAEISGSLLDRKLDAIEASGADTVVSGDVSCLVHIAGGLRRRGSAIKVKHLAELLAERRS
jgi:L-lactate dehydrogenase complex protein LldE